MTETDRIVAWLRREAASIGQDAGDDLSLRTAAAFIHGCANDIEHGAHLKRPEPTISAEEWLPKSNLTY